MRRVARPVVATLTLAVLAAACIPATFSPPPRPTPTTTPAPAATVTPTDPTGSGGPGSGVRVDPALLDVLPTEIDGVPLTADPATAGEIAADGSVAPFIDAIAVATAFGPLATDGAADYAVVTLAHLRPGVFGSAFHRGWRDTFDAAVCEQAGGVDGNAEAEIAGHRTYIGTCAGGVRTYHVHLPGPGILVSLQSAGERRFGERIVAGLTE